LWLVLPLAYFLYLYQLDASGLLGPDEPRYAAVGRAMAHTGDWVTPRLWGQPWFEKPALLYWMTASGFRLGLGPELAPRLPVALMALGFLGFYWWILRREFGCMAAWFATLILATCGGWVAFSQVGVTDLPLAATFSAAMLLSLPWIAKGDTRWLPVASALLGLAVLAKGLVPLVLALPLVMRGRIRDLIRWRVVLPFCVVALPWYALCYLRNGRTFLDVFFGQHTFGRFLSPGLQHGQPWWFYLPVLLTGLLPWTPLVFLVALRGTLRDPRRLFLGAWLLFGMVFFSVAVNKLPGYLLPLLPALTALIGIGLEEVENPAPWLAVSAVSLATFPMVARALPTAVAAGLSRASLPTFSWTWLLPVAAASAAWVMSHRGWRLAAVAMLAACSTAGFVYLKRSVMPEVSQAASARSLWSEIEARAGEVCVDDIHRNWRYGLNYYSVTPLPDCEQQPRPLAVRQTEGQPPHVAPTALVDRTQPGRTLLERSLPGDIISPFRN
jgi:4-amino-4-deoxy-L-arabinose transferase-like glycosyltransferase